MIPLKVQELQQQVDQLASRCDVLESEVARLRRGNFTEEEFQSLCHTFSEDDPRRFKKGCQDYQQSLFQSDSVTDEREACERIARSMGDDLKARLRHQEANVAYRIADEIRERGNDGSSNSAGG